MAKAGKAIENVFRTVRTVRKTFSVLLEGVFQTVDILIYSVETKFNSVFPSNCSTQKVLKIKKMNIYLRNFEDIKKIGLTYVIIFFFLTH